MREGKLTHIHRHITHTTQFYFKNLFYSPSEQLNSSDGKTVFKFDSVTNDWSRNTLAGPARNG